MTNMPKIHRLAVACAFAFAAFCGQNVAAAENKLEVVGAEISDHSETTSGEITSFSGNNIINSVTFGSVDDYVNFKITLKNTGDTSSIITGISDDNALENVLYEYDSHADEEVKPGEELTLNVKTTYKTAVADADREQSFSVALSIESESVTKEAGATDTEEADDEDGLAVPNTGAGFFGSGSAASAGVVIVGTIIIVAGYILYKRRGNAKTLIIPMLAVAVFTPFMAKAVEGSAEGKGESEVSTVTFVNDFNFNDRKTTSTLKDDLSWDQEFGHEIYSGWPLLQTRTDIVHATAADFATVRSICESDTEEKIISNDYYPALQCKVISTDDSEFPTYAWLRYDEEAADLEDHGSDPSDQRPVEILYYSDADIIYLAEDSSSLFSGFNLISGLDLTGFDTSRVKNMSRLFNGTKRYLYPIAEKALVPAVIDTSNFNTSNVEDMSNMFTSFGDYWNSWSPIDSSDQMIDIDLTTFNTSNVRDFYQMFYNSDYWMGRMDVLDLSSFDTSKGENFYEMFGTFYFREIIVSDKFVVPEDQLADLGYLENLRGSSDLYEYDDDDNLTKDMYRPNSLDGSYFGIFSNADFVPEEGAAYLLNSTWFKNVVSWADNVLRASKEKFEEVYNDRVENREMGTIYVLSRKAGLPVYGWQDYDDDAFYIYSEADKIYLPEDSSFIFDIYEMETLDLTGFDFSKILDATDMFGGWDTTTIYVDKNPTWNESVFTTSGDYFSSTTHYLEGGMGTTFLNTEIADPSDCRGRKYAVIDDPDNGQPGYFTHNVLGNYITLGDDSGNSYSGSQRP